MRAPDPDAPLVWRHMPGEVFSVCGPRLLC